MRLGEYADAVQVTSGYAVQVGQPVSIQLWVPVRVDDWLHEHRDGRLNCRNQGRGSLDIFIQRRMVDEDLDVEIFGAREI